MLPADIRDPLVTHPRRTSLLEVVLDLGRRPEARFLGERGGEYLREAEVLSGPDGWRRAGLGAEMSIAGTADGFLPSLAK